MRARGHFEYSLSPLERDYRAAQLQEHISNMEISLTRITILDSGPTHFRGVLSYLKKPGKEENLHSMCPSNPLKNQLTQRAQRF